jgi:hypothetical protein
VLWSFFRYKLRLASNLFLALGCLGFPDPDSNCQAGLQNSAIYDPFEEIISEFFRTPVPGSKIVPARRRRDIGGTVRRCEQRFFSVEGAFLQLTLPNFKQQCCHGDVPDLSIVLPWEPT